jgi:uncharacterized membrane protein
MAKGYDAIGLYYDESDPRLWVPKRIASMGWTVNVGHPFGPAVLLAIGAVTGSAATACLLTQ